MCSDAQRQEDLWGHKREGGREDFLAVMPELRPKEGVGPAEKGGERRTHGAACARAGAEGRVGTAETGPRRSAGARVLVIT